MKIKNKGFSLIELLVTVAVLSIVSGAAISMMYQSQFVYTEQSQMAETSQNIRSAMDQVIRVVRQAGSDPLEMIAAPAITVLGDGYVQVSSDLTGSIASTTGNSMESVGDPDGTLSSIGEVVTFRFDSDSDQLFMDMGYGEGLLADNLSEFNLTFFDEAGSATTVDQDIAFVRISMTGRDDDSGLQTGRRNAQSFSSDVFLRSSALMAGNSGYSGSTGGAAEEPADEEDPPVEDPKPGKGKGRNK
jgi:prepilin-type N-terminal cleavage/methylation domain-containing protein